MSVVLLAPPRLLAPVTITLDPRDLTYGHELGVSRTRRVGDPRRDKFDPAAVGLDRLGNDVESALCEVAAARILRRPLPCSALGAVDLPPDVEVRGGRRLDGSLIHRRRDKIRCRFVLVVGTAPTYTLAGWIYGTQARQDEWLRDPHGFEAAWFVPASALCRSLDDLLGEER